MAQPRKKGAGKKKPKRKTIRIADVDPKGKLDAIDLDILRIKYSSPFLTLEQVAKLVGLGTKQAVHKRWKKQSFQDAWGRITLDIRNTLRVSQHKAMFVADSLLGNKDDRVKLGACNLVLKPFLQSPQAAPAPPDMKGLEFLDENQQLIK